MRHLIASLLCLRRIHLCMRHLHCISFNRLLSRRTSGVKLIKVSDKALRIEDEHPILIHGFKICRDELIDAFEVFGIGGDNDNLVISSGKALFYFSKLLFSGCGD